MKTPLVHVLKIGPINLDPYDIVLSPVSTNKEGRVFSPFIIGPVRLPAIEGASNPSVFQNFENAWQFSKVYSSLGHLDAFGNLTDKYRTWRRRGIIDTTAHRYPAGRNAVPQFSVFGKRRLSYITARKMLYVPYYMRHIKDVPMLDELRAEYRKGAKILLMDFDASEVQNKRDFQQNVDDPNRKLGHAYVLREAIIRDDSKWYRKIIL